MESTSVIASGWGCPLLALTWNLGVLRVPRNDCRALVCYCPLLSLGLLAIRTCSISQLLVLLFTGSNRS